MPLRGQSDRAFVPWGRTDNSPAIHRLYLSSYLSVIHRERDPQRRTPSIRSGVMSPRAHRMAYGGKPSTFGRNE